jgi:hypothetical protein
MYNLLGIGATISISYRMPTDKISQLCFTLEPISSGYPKSYTHWLKPVNDATAAKGHNSDDTFNMFK